MINFKVFFQGKEENVKIHQTKIMSDVLLKSVEIFQLTDHVSLESVRLRKYESNRVRINKKI